MATVMVVDDIDVNRDLVCTVLGSSGYETVQANGGAAALSMLREAQPDLILTDVMMPGVDGFQLARRVREELAPESIPVLFYTADYLAQARRIEALGVHRIILKNGDLRELIEAVQDTLEATA